MSEPRHSDPDQRGGGGGGASSGGGGDRLSDALLGVTLDSLVTANASSLGQHHRGGRGGARGGGRGRGGDSGHHHQRSHVRLNMNNNNNNSDDDDDDDVVRDFHQFHNQDRRSQQQQGPPHRHQQQRRGREDDNTDFNFHNSNPQSLYHQSPAAAPAAVMMANPAAAFAAPMAAMTAAPPLPRREASPSTLMVLVGDEWQRLIADDPALVLRTWTTWNCTFATGTTVDAADAVAAKVHQQQEQMKRQQQQQQAASEKKTSGSAHTSSDTLFLGNLPRVDIDPDDVRAFLRSVLPRGIEVSKVRSMKEKRFGFVQFNSYGDAAVALEAIRGAHMDGCVIRPQYAAPSSSAGNVVAKRFDVGDERPVLQHQQQPTQEKQQDQQQPSDENCSLPGVAVVRVWGDTQLATLVNHSVRQLGGAQSARSLLLPSGAGGSTSDEQAAAGQKKEALPRLRVDLAYVDFNGALSVSSVGAVEVATGGGAAGPAAGGGAAASRGGGRGGRGGRGGGRGGGAAASAMMQSNLANTLTMAHLGINAGSPLLVVITAQKALLDLPVS